MNILAINPGSTSTKIAVSLKNELFEETIVHDREELNQFEEIYQQKDFRFNCVTSVLKEKGWDSIQFDAVVGRGGMIKPVEGGVYEVNLPMLEDLKTGVSGAHASNLGGVIANMFAGQYGVKSFIVDPVVIDEMKDVAKFSGLKGVERKSLFHALNQKAVARDIAELLEKNYDDLNFIVAHLGGGISVGAHQNGRVIDVNNALSGDGPFSPERAGGLPVDGLSKYIQQNDCTSEELISLVSRSGGVYSYLGIVEVRDLEKMHRDGNKEATAVLEAMIYQISKEIGALSAVLKGKVDGIILTGGIAYSQLVTDRITESVKFISTVYKKPGGMEMQALVDGAKRVLEGRENVKEYS